MGHFDGMKNQKEKEIYYQKFISAFICLVEDHLSAENNRQEQSQSIPKVAVIPGAKQSVTSNTMP